MYLPQVGDEAGKSTGSRNKYSILQAFVKEMYGMRFRK
jgi:hypothetical protein